MGRRIEVAYATGSRLSCQTEPFLNLLGNAPGRVPTPIDEELGRVAPHDAWIIFAKPGGLRVGKASSFLDDREAHVIPGETAFCMSRDFAIADAAK